jgi:hypothetical protein
MRYDDDNGLVYRHFRVLTPDIQLNHRSHFKKKGDKTEYHQDEALLKPS